MVGGLGFTHLENISQWEGLSHIWNGKKFQTTNQYVCIYIYIGKTSYFTELNQGQLAGDDAPNPNQHSTVMAMTISYNWL